MAATIAVAYPHMNAVGGDAFWLVREPGGRVRAIEACGPAGSLADDRALPGQGLRCHPAARAGRRPDGGRSRRGLAGRPRLCPKPRRQDPAVRAPDRRGAPRARGLSRVRLGSARGPERGGSAASGARLRRDVPRRRQDAAGRHRAQASGARRHARPSRGSRARRFLSRRCRPRDRRRPRADRQPRHARRLGGLPRAHRRAVVAAAAAGHPLQFPAADAGARRPPHPRHLREARHPRGRRSPRITTASSKR